MLNKDWSNVQLGDLVTIKHGWPFQSKYFTEFQDHQPIVVNIGNFRYTGGFRFESTALKGYKGNYPKEFVLQPNDILLVMTCQTAGGEILGIPGRIPADGRTYLHNQRMGKVVVKAPSKVVQDFLYWLFLSPEFNRHLAITASGTKILHTSPNRIEEYRFYLPPLSEQKAIANILDTLGNKIELNRQMNETLETMARSIFKSWFVDFDPVRAKIEGLQPVGMDAETAAQFPNSFENSEKGEIPKEWKIGALTDIAEVIMGQSPPGETYNVSGEGLPFYQGIRDFGNRFPIRRVYCTASTRFADKGDVLFSVRAPVGSLNIANEYCGIGRGLAALRAKDGFRSFLFSLMKATQHRWEMFEAEGTVFGAVTKDDVFSFSVLVPPQDIIKSYCRLVSPLDAKIELNENESIALASIRDLLLPKMLSGEIMVKGAEKFIEDNPLTGE